MTCLAQAGEEEPSPKKVLSKFQDILSQVPEWNVDKVERETQKIIMDSRCDYLEELLTAVFIAHTKILTAIRLGSKNKKVQITIPKLNHFLHRALTECSRLLWTNVYLFQSDLPSIEKQKNHRQIEGLLQEGIQHAIRGLLPVKNILKDYLAEGGDDEEEEDAEVEAEAEEEASKKVEETKPIVPVPSSESSSENVPSSESSSENVHPIEAVSVSSAEPAQQPISLQQEIELPQTLEQLSAEPEIKTVEVVQAPLPPAVEEKQEVTTPLMILQSTPSVHFADKVHVFQPGSDTPMQFHDFPTATDETDDSIRILDEEGEELDEFEDLEQTAPEELGGDDFETL